MRRIHPSMPREVAARILSEEHGDLRARWIMNELAAKLYGDGDVPRALKAASASLIHACAYLEDREEYTARPWPKNMIKVMLPPPCAHPTFRGESR